MSWHPNLYTDSIMISCSASHILLDVSNPIRMKSTHVKLIKSRTCWSTARKSVEICLCRAWKADIDVYFFARSMSSSKSSHNCVRPTCRLNVNESCLLDGKTKYRSSRGTNVQLKSPPRSWAPLRPSRWCRSILKNAFRSVFSLGTYTLTKIEFRLD